ncbi:Serine/Threonine kinase domain protein (macronuclear) [Tetrahymena thermophila SB210]|uniref:Serine/Threonine kinase domain protein n=1 Tax=Tetrahymena thermophila (strain SB210) TaxID=312017 RepID=Q23R88_TETTS|nr:Serine/Threonine kinase domain protein [Tetrahymena thermophila SB210]EAR99160.1 Serine/Threonine kinase domain protein [Tetrahymena thermophila SB210]|eukprot:XP_001019405.1 Serine/Threonine kinase domain protein [Tetrahymena thermophila SB210]
MDLLLKYSPDKQIENYAFSLSACIGKGSSGTVYVGRHQQTQQVVAIKAVDMRSLKTEYAWKMLCSEVKIMKKLKHPHVVRLLDVFQTKNNTYIITEFCNQGDLRTYLKKKKSLTEREAITVISQIMSGLQELANNGIIHRDLKPANILIHDDVFKITDFGFAKKLDSMEDQLMDSLVGTPLYMAPQILNKQQYTSKCDVWSIGLILYELLFGRTPWPAVNVVDLVQKMCTVPLQFPKDQSISQALVNFISKCLQFPESDRISIQEMCANSLFEDYVQQINRLLSQQKLQNHPSGSSTNTNSQNNLSDFSSVATQAQKNVQNNSSANDTQTPGAAYNRNQKQPQIGYQQGQTNQINVQQEKVNQYQNQPSATNLGVTPSSGMNMQINLNTQPQSSQQSSSMSPVRAPALQQQSGSGRTTERNVQIQEQNGGCSPLKQLSNQNEPYSPISPIRTNYQKQQSASSYNSQIKSMNSIQDQLAQANGINSSQKNMSTSKQNIQQYPNQPKNYPSSFHNLNAFPQQEKNIQSSEGNENQNVKQPALVNNFVKQSKDQSPTKTGLYNDNNFYQVLNNVSNYDKGLVVEQQQQQNQLKSFNDEQKNQPFGYSSNQQKQNFQGLPPQSQASQNSQFGVQRQYTNETASSPQSSSPTIVQLQSAYSQQGQNIPALQIQQKPELKAEVMFNNINNGQVSPYRQQDGADRKFQERGLFLQQVQDQSPVATNLNIESKNSGLYLQQQVSQPYQNNTSISNKQQDNQGVNLDSMNTNTYNNQGKFDESRFNQVQLKQYSLSHQYSLSRQNQPDQNNQAATPNRNISPQSKNQSVYTSEKNSSSEQSPTSSVNQQAGQYILQQPQTQFVQNRYSQNNNSNSASGYSTVIKSGDNSSNQDQVNSRQNSPSNYNPSNNYQQQQQQQNVSLQNQQIQQLQANQQQIQKQRSGGDSPDIRYKAYSFTASNGLIMNKSGGLNNTNISTRSITATNNSNSSPKNNDSEGKISYNSNGYHSQQQQQQQQQQINNSKNTSSNHVIFGNLDQQEIGDYKNQRQAQQNSGQKKDYESVIQIPYESNGNNLNHQNIPFNYKRSMTQNNEHQDYELDNYKNTYTPKNNSGAHSYANLQKMQGISQNEFRNSSPNSVAQLIAKKNSEQNQLPRSPLERRRKSEFGIGLSNKNQIYQKEIKNTPFQQFSQAQLPNNSRNQITFYTSNTQQVKNQFLQSEENYGKNNILNQAGNVQNPAIVQNQYSRSRSLHNNAASKYSNTHNISPANTGISPKNSNNSLSDIKKKQINTQDYSKIPSQFFGNSTSPKAQTKYQAYLQNTLQVKNQQQGVNQPTNLIVQKHIQQSGNEPQQMNEIQGNQQFKEIQREPSQQLTADNSPNKYAKYALKNYLLSQNNQGSSAVNYNNSNIQNQNNTSSQMNSSGNKNTQNLNINSKTQNSLDNLGSNQPQQQQQILRNQNQYSQINPHHHGHSKSFSNNFNQPIVSLNSQQEITQIENTSNNNMNSNSTQNEFYAQDNMIESILCICKSVRFLKNQIDYNIKSILKLDEPFLYEKLIFLLNKHLVIQISMLKITQMDKGINVINLDRWTEYRASQNFNEVYKKIAQNYYDIISTHQNNWNRAHENQRFYDESKKDYYFSKIFNQQLTQYNSHTNSGQNSSNSNPQNNEEDNTNFYFYIYQLLKEIIKEVFNKLQNNLSKYLDLDNSKITREDSLVINCLSRLVDYHQLLKLIISQKEDFSLILKSINITEFLKEKIITIEFYEALKQKMYIYDLITK